MSHFAFSKYRKSTGHSLDAITLRPASIQYTFTEVMTNSTATRTNFVTSNSATLTSGRAYILLLVNKYLATPTNDPTVSGCGLTWTKIYSVNSTGNNVIRHSVFVGTGTPSNGTITTTLNESNGMWEGLGLVEASNVNTSSPVVQVHRSETFSSATLATTMTTFSNANNIGVSLVNRAEATDGIITVSGWTEIGTPRTIAGATDAYEVSLKLAQGAANSNSFSVDHGATSEYKYNLSVELATL